SANNRATWPAEMAGQFNQVKKGGWFIGIWHQEMNHYMYDSQNVYANRVFAPNATYSYQLSLLKEETPQPPVPDNAWNATKIYTSGDVVMHKQQTWTAQWWTKNEEPGTTGEWGVWR
ncbi:carbohydrate-binding protein, partial [Vibrio anguillarum]|nr:Spindolin [Vibrio anguillarum]